MTSTTSIYNYSLNEKNILVSKYQLPVKIENLWISSISPDWLVDADQILSNKGGPAVYSQIRKGFSKKG